MNDAPRQRLIEYIADGDLRRAGIEMSAALRAAGVLDADARRFGELIEGVWWSRQQDTSGLRDTCRRVERVLERSRPAGLAPLVLGYIRIVCEQAWELSWDHGPIKAVIEAAAPVPDPETGGSRSAEELAAGTALRLLRHEMTVETACSVGSPTEFAEQADRGAEQARALARQAGALAEGSLRDWLVELSEELEGRLGALAEAGRALHRGLRGVRGAAAALATAEERLLALEREEGYDPASASELRAHRSTLAAVRAAAEREWLRVDAGSVTMVFPFGLRTVDHAAVVAVVKDYGKYWSLVGRDLGNAPSNLLLIDDIWRGEDPLRRRYEGTELELPDLAVSVGGHDFTLRVAVVVSQIGNHHLRVEVDLEDLLPHEVAAVRMLAAPEYGDLTELGRSLRFAGEDGEPDREEAGQEDGGPAAAGWPTLTAFVTETLADLAERIADPEERGTPDPERGIEAALSFRPGMFHVITRIDRASALSGGDPDRERPLDAGAGIPDLFGAAAVCAPLPSGVGTLADWTIGEPSPGTEVDTDIAPGALLLVHANHTLIAALTAPSFMVTSIRQVVDFSVSLEGMFAAWQDELSRFQISLAPFLAEYAEGFSGEAALSDIERDVAELEQLNLHLRRVVNAARTSLLFIGSPALVSSPVVRQTLTTLLDLNPVWVRRADFTDSAGAALSDRFEELIRGWDDRRTSRLEARNRVMVETLLAGVAGIGISGLASIMQEGFGMTGWESTVWLIVAVVVLAVLIGVIAYRWIHTTRVPRRRTDPRPTGRHREEASDAPRA